MAEMYLDGASIATPLSSILRIVKLRAASLPVWLVASVRGLDIGLRLSHGSF